MDADDFIRRWSEAPISERAHYQTFVAQLCRLIGVAAPDDERTGGLLGLSGAATSSVSGSTSPMTQPIPAEWTPHRAMWVGWPSHAELWGEDFAQAQDEVEALVRALAGQAIL